MKFLYNNKIFRERRRDLRKTQTKPEKILWQEIRSSKLGAHKFRRQYSAGPYILDFYCPQIRLAVEIDGPHHDHENEQLYDQERTKYLESINIKVIRFKNEEIVSETKTVIKKILESITLS